jgi:DNA polymerase-4
MRSSKEALRIRTPSRLGVDVRVGIGPSITVAGVTGWLGPLQVAALHGIGPRQAAALRDYGIHCVGLLAAVPSATVQPLLSAEGRTAGRRPPRRPRALPATASVRYRFDEHTTARRRTVA